MTGLLLPPYAMVFGAQGALMGVAPYVFTNTEASTLVAAMTEQPSNPRKALIDDLVGGLKSDGIWTECDAILGLAAHDSQASLIDWKLPTRVAVPVNSPTFQADRGWTGDGAASRLRTNYTPSVDGAKFVQDSASAWVWVLTNAADGAADIGNNSVSPQMRIKTRGAAGPNFLMEIAANDAANTGIGGGLNSTSIGFSGVQRRGATDRRAFRNGAQVGGQANPSTGVPTSEQWICGGNATFFSTKQIGFAVWASSLAGLEAALYARVLTYMQAVGAA